MAAKAISLSSLVESELQCPICYELFTSPRCPKELPGCQHVCCELCLQDMIRHSEDQIAGTIRCPECREECRVPIEGISQLKTNLRLRNLAEIHKSQEQRKDQSGAVMPEYDRCRLHGLDVMFFYCKTCSQSICKSCLVPSHLNHDVKKQLDIFEAQKQQLAEQLEAANQELQLCEQKLEELSTNQQYERQKIERCAASHISTIQERERQLLKELENYESKHLLRIQEEEKQLECKLQMVQLSTEDQDDHRLIDSFTAIMKNIEGDLNDEVDSLSIDISTSNTLRFVPAPIPTSKQTLGNIEVNDKQSLPAEIPEEQTGESATNVINQKHTTVERIKPHQYKSNTSLKANKQPSETPRNQKTVKTMPTMPYFSTNTPMYAASGAQGSRSLRRSLTDSEPLNIRLKSSVGHLTDATAVSFNNNILAVCDAGERQILICIKDGDQYTNVMRIDSTQPNDVCVLENGTIVIANGENAVLISDINTRDCNYRPKRIRSFDDDRKLKPRIQSVIAISDNTFLLGDVARKVILRCTTSSSQPEEVIPCTIKPHHMTSLSDNRIAISNCKTVVIKNLSSVGTYMPELHVSYAHGLCFMPSIGNGILLIAKRKKSGSLPTQNRMNTGTIVSCFLDGPKKSSDNPLADRLYKPGGMARISNDEVAVADKHSVKIYQFVQSPRQHTISIY